MIPKNQRVLTARGVSQSVIPRDNITEKFTEAASKLKTGQLVKDEYFTLFEAVGALEIMDSKMDSGYLGPDENEQSLNDDYDVSRQLTPEEVVGIMDELLCHEVAWHMGHPLSQTLFTSLYLDKLLWPVPRDPEDFQFGRGKPAGDKTESELVHVVLRAYCLALVKCCDFVHTRVIREFYYEVT
ncbi:Mak10 subunit, NatC N-terminal acetyltransferase-domain-containing protein [Aspergillus californicus]